VHPSEMSFVKRYENNRVKEIAACKTDKKALFFIILSLGLRKYNYV
jgi:hypothetical protein